MSKKFTVAALMFLTSWLCQAQSMTDLVAQGDKFYGKKEYKKAFKYLNSDERLVLKQWVRTEFALD